MRIVVAVVGLLAASMGPCVGAAEEAQFVRELIRKYSEDPRGNPPASIWRFNYRGSEVFYIPPSCCDVYSELYDSNGVLLCAPDGGLTGRGDGRCPDFAAERSAGVLVWKDPRDGLANQ